jgi:DNA modification methylase
MSLNTDLFGKPIIEDGILRDKFIEPPFSVLDTKSGNWQKRKKLWISKGLKSEVGRDVQYKYGFNPDKMQSGKKEEDRVSVFDPALCEVLYHWFCPENGTILDPFAGGSVRGIVANYLGYKYTGIDIRQEQIDSNREQGLDILPVNNQPSWYVGDSNELLDGKWERDFDFVFSCPPYADLEVYSDLEGDISNKPYKQFLELYESIILKSCKLLKSGCFACFVVGEVRDKKGNYIGFVPDTINAFRKAGMDFYNEAILLNSIASASMRANGNMKSQKLVKVHQNILVFRKP